MDTFIPAAQFLDTLELYHAAMYRHLGDRCQVSRSGYSVIFAPEHRLCGRADLSGMPAHALAQLRYAGIDPAEVTADDRTAYRQWQDEQNARHRVETGRFVVSGTVNEPYRGSEGACGYFTYVRLMAAGASQAVDRIECREVYDPDATNLMGRKGAFRHLPDAVKIGQAIARMRRDFPELANVPVYCSDEVGTHLASLEEDES